MEYMYGQTNCLNKGVLSSQRSFFEIVNYFVTFFVQFLLTKKILKHTEYQLKL